MAGGEAQMVTMMMETVEALRAAKNASEGGGGGGGGGGDDGCGDGGDSSSFKYSWVVAVVLCVLSAVVINFGTNLQKFAWNQRQKKPFAEDAVVDDPEDLRRLDAGQADGHSDDDEDADEDAEVDPEVEAKFRRSWALGFVAIVIGSLFDFAALGFGAQSVIAPLGSLTLVANMFFAQYMHGEKLTQQDVLATGVIFIGCVLSVAFASHKNEICGVDALLGLYATLRFAIYAVSILSLLAGGFCFVQYIESVVSAYGTRSKQYKQLFRYHRFSYAFLAGVAGAQSVLFAKSLDELLVASFTGHSRIFLAHIGSYLVFLGMLASVTLQVYWLNCALARFDALYVVPVFQAQWIVFGVIGGGVFYGEFSGFSFGQAIAFLSGVIMTVLGVYILSQRGFIAPTVADDASDSSAEDRRSDSYAHLAASASSASALQFGRSAASIDPMSTPLLDGSDHIKSYASYGDNEPAEYEVVFEKRRIQLTLGPCVISHHPSGRRRKRPVRLWRVTDSRVRDPESPIRPDHVLIAVDNESVVGPRVSPEKVISYLLNGPRPITVRFRTVLSAEPPLLSTNDTVTGLDSADRLEPFLDPEVGPDSDDDDIDYDSHDDGAVAAFGYGVQSAGPIAISGRRSRQGGDGASTSGYLDDEAAAYSEGELGADDGELQHHETASVGFSTPRRSRKRIQRKRSDLMRSSLRSASLQGPGLSPFYGIIQSWKERRSGAPPSTPSPSFSQLGPVALDSVAQGRNRRRTGSAPPVVTASEAEADPESLKRPGTATGDEALSSAARAV